MNIRIGKMACFLIIALTAIVLLSGCLEGPQGPPGPKGDQGDAGPAGGWIQGPNRVVVYDEYTLTNPAATSNTTALVAFNGSNTSWANSTIAAQPDYPRNVIVSTNASTETWSGGVGAMWAKVYGYDVTGANQTENITVPKTGMGNGTKAFSNITHIQFGNGTTTKQVRAGYGPVFGVPNYIKYSSDLVFARIAGSHTAVSAQTVNVTYNTIKFSTAPDGSTDYEIIYKGYGVTP